MITSLLRRTRGPSRPPGIRWAMHTSFDQTMYHLYAYDKSWSVRRVTREKAQEIKAASLEDYGGVPSARIKQQYGGLMHQRTSSDPLPRTAVKCSTANRLHAAYNCTAVVVGGLVCTFSTYYTHTSVKCSTANTNTATLSWCAVGLHLWLPAHTNLQLFEDHNNCYVQQ